MQGRVSKEQQPIGAQEMNWELTLKENAKKQKQKKNKTANMVKSIAIIHFAWSQKTE